MEHNREGYNVLPYMAYGDALGFLKENSDEYSCLRPFSYSYNRDLKLEMQKGQWSYITQLTLINCKCFVDNKEKNRVLIDYTRMAEEIKLWKYYRCGTPPNYMHKLNLGKNYYISNFYREDKRGMAFSRIIPIALANKNFIAAQEETYKNIAYINGHPQVILTGLLLLRTVYLLMNNTMPERKGLVNELKDYLTDLQLPKLEQNINRQLRTDYKIQFEQEKVDYLIDLDRIKHTDFCSGDISCSKDIFLSALTNFFRLYRGKDMADFRGRDQKEIYTIVYALSALVKQTENIEISGTKDIAFIKNMSEYLFKLKEYKIGRKFFKDRDKRSSDIDLFLLRKGTVIKHPILNNIIIKDKMQLNNCIGLVVRSKTGEYRFLREK